ncbi:FAD-dependent oxidoreductase [Cryptosporangium aurantiacum]|uniref:2-polyprenyl-6-methoxyphenol hydroxylase n=1 Tax=Cryptosporangium aurantiacum TaxID=134849 RepID=A0A1M7RER0_9ACTN|nr:FAD-dependent oxidoreductase [Cryptosporangium aurantiacum]SHN44706.1 2-polyprenyl-6-methoxyphenol hydroxylase [Cryptosporangium aurantiacum]
MADVLILGAGMTGLTTAMLLARDGHHVTVVDQNSAGPAHDAWSSWQRPGVPQFRLPHIALPRWRALIEQDLPDVLGELLERGGRRYNLLAEGVWPIEAGSSHRTGDERFDVVGARRPILEAAVAAAASRTAGVTIRRGVAVTGLLTGLYLTPGAPRVTGVRTRDGENLYAELVVDATGRRSSLPRLLAGIKAAAPLEEREEDGFVYYSRHYRSTDGSRPTYLGWLTEHFESLSTITLAADNDTWSVSFAISSRDRELRALRDVDVFERAATLYGNSASWSTIGEPITGVLSMANLEDRYRRLVVDGEPVVTGLVAVGDAWAATNPTLGLGLTLGALHGIALRDLLRDVNPQEHEKLARRFDEVTEETLTPYFRTLRSWSRHRRAEVAADIAGRPYETNDHEWLIAKALDAAKFRDPRLLRAAADIGALTAPAAGILDAPGLVDTVMALGGAAPQYTAPGPRRADLLSALA